MGKKKSKKEKRKKKAKKADKLAKQCLVAKGKKKADKKKKKLKKKSKSEKKINKVKFEENINKIVKETIIEKPILVVQDEPKETVSKSVKTSETIKTLTGSRRLTAKVAIAKIKTYKTKLGIDNFTQFENRLTVLKAAKVKKRQLK
ncbi:MAG: hypothetical protein P8Q42_09355 [Flavobacteriales bacterium]|nr:hypothetical protein [Flavobacteriales bacterium]|tara:strand:- start:64 stop:501 length:438 start_codon:yes stop_codon:yes gene_type:complete